MTPDVGEYIFEIADVLDFKQWENGTLMFCMYENDLCELSREDVKSLITQLQEWYDQGEEGHEHGP